MKKNEVQINMADYAVLIWKWKTFLLGLSFSATVTAIVISLILPKTYTATTSLMQPQNSGSQFTNLMKDIPFSELLGVNIGGDDLSDTFLAILKSRVLRQTVINEFDLEKVYKFDRRKRYYIEDLFKQLDLNVEAKTTGEGLIRITVKDKSPERAANMANFMARQLDSIYNELVIEEAFIERTFLEERLTIIKTELKNAEADLVTFQKQHKVLLPYEQSKATLHAISEIEANYLATKLKLDIARKKYHKEHSTIRDFEIALKQMAKQKDDFNSKRISDIFIPSSIAPDIGIEYSRLERNVRIQGILFKLILQEYERAKLQEAKDTPKIQILDRAVPPQRKSSPKRMIIVVSSFFGSLLLGFILINLFEYFFTIRENQTEEYVKLRGIFKGTKK
ncbi:GumC family protein [Fibrobacterota bacterium]